MPDKFSKEIRSNIMKSIKSESKLENKVSKALWHRGLRFRKNDKALFGKPDISIKKYKLVIFIDSCFWHFCEIHGHIPKSNQEYWIKKIHRNMERDKKVTQYYEEKNWNIVRLWEHQLKKTNFETTLDELAAYIIDIKKNK